MATCFDIAFTFTMSQEGGEVTHDPRLTKWGCEYAEACAYRKAHNQHVPTEAEFIQWWTEADSKPIFLMNYWTPAQCDKLPAPLDAVVFDTAVNMGTGTALHMLAQAHGTATPAKVETYLNVRRARYRQIVVEHPNNHIYLTDWLGRCDRIAAAIANHHL